MNNFFIQKVKDTCKNFDSSGIDPMDILTYIKPHNINNLSSPLTNVKEVIEYINALKNSNALDHDQLNSKILKRMKFAIAPHITHLINSSIRQSTCLHVFFNFKATTYLKKTRTKTSQTATTPCQTYV